eukprot:5675026-Pleurochrysis_carterae.AAC.4
MKLTSACAAPSPRGESSYAASQQSPAISCRCVGDLYPHRGQDYGKTRQAEAEEEDPNRADPFRPSARRG